MLDPTNVMENIVSVSVRKNIALQTVTATYQLAKIHIMTYSRFTLIVVNCIISSCLYCIVGGMGLQLPLALQPLPGDNLV